MPSRDSLPDPTDLDAISALTRRWAESRTVHPIGISRIVVSEEGLDTLAEEARSRRGEGLVLLVSDQTPMRRGASDLKSLAREALASRLPLRTWQPASLQGGCASLETARTLARELQDCSLLVALGSGSITDVCKYARHLIAESSGQRPEFISFATAASVTAYTSSLAVLSVDGVKRTLPAAPPDAVICDLPTLCSAPVAMTRAGFGDVMARSVSQGDWYLAGKMGMDDTYNLLPMRLLEHAEEEMIARADGIAASRIDSVRAVMSAVLLAGMAMSLVNQTAPLSGWEHVISHFLDLIAPHEGRQNALHGGQVGVASLIAARAYERAWDDLDLDRLLREIDADRYRANIEQVFRPYDPSGRLIAEIGRDIGLKLARWHAAADTRRRFVADKRSGQYDEELRRIVRPSAEIADALRRAGAPTRFADLDVPIPVEAARGAVRYGHLIRARFTLGDLLDAGGYLNDESVGALLEETA